MGGGVRWLGSHTAFTMYITSSRVQYPCGPVVSARAQIELKKKRKEKKPNQTKPKKKKNYPSCSLSSASCFKSGLARYRCGLRKHWVNTHASSSSLGPRDLL